MDKVAKVQIHKKKQNTDKHAYQSSCLLNAYKQFKKIERKAENDKFRKIQAEAQKKEGVEITDASNFKKNIQNINTDTPFFLGEMQFI